MMCVCSAISVSSKNHLLIATPANQTPQSLSLSSTESTVRCYQMDLIKFPLRGKQAFLMYVSALFWSRVKYPTLY